MTVAVERQIETRGARRPAGERLVVSLITALLAFSVTAFAPQILNDGDTYLHVAAGLRMLAQHAILYSDPFSYTFAGTPWDAHEWLAQIAMAAAFQGGGWSALVLLFAASAAVATALLAHHLGRWLDWKAQALAVVIALSCMTASLLARPHLLALPLLELWTAELVIARSEKRSPPLWLLPLMTIWVNIHGSFLFGLALAAALALEALFGEKDRSAVWRGWGLFGAGALGAALINPHFIRGVFFPFTLMGTSSLGNIAEWQAIDLSRPQPLVFVILAAIYFAVTRGVKIPAFRALIVLALLYMALQHQRHQLIFAVTAPLLLAEQLSLNFVRSGYQDSARVLRPAAAYWMAALVLVLGLTVLRFAQPVIRVDGPVAPITALEHVPQSVRALPVLNDYSFGGYLIFKGVRTFVDSRVELYGDGFLRNYAQIIRPDPGAIKMTLRADHIAWTILSARSPVVTVMDSLAGWHRLYTDNYAVVHIRDKQER